MKGLVQVRNHSVANIVTKNCIITTFKNSWKNSYWWKVIQLLTIWLRHFLRWVILSVMKGNTLERNCSAVNIAIWSFFSQVIWNIMKGYILGTSHAAVQIVKGKFLDQVIWKFMKEIIAATSPSAVSIVTRIFICQVI